MQTINVTPSPRILEVITNNPMHPINALCEIIDNSIDSFKTAEIKGVKVENPVVDISLPSKRELDDGIGKLVIRDNGIGLKKDEANNAVRAGYSGNNPFERLGLFGMGFNISTGKLGQKTVLTSGERNDSNLFCITINIPELVRSKTFDVPIEEKPRPTPDFSGVLIEVSEWWPEGTQNAKFINKLVSIGIPKLARQIGRRYSTLLRKKLKIFINGKECPVYRHCIWDKKRYVTRKNSKIPARYDFDEIFGLEKRCFSCGSLVEESVVNCQYCGDKGDIRTKERRIRGFVGIQRFDDTDRWGVDFIRNGRAILVEDKDALFNWSPEKTGEKIKEYPVDGIYGRIIGEVHIDHVPTDFLKTDFQRTSKEWDEIVKFLRGESCLLPETRRRLDEPDNDSPICKLFQGYRKVREIGTKDMYMGYWDEARGGPARISREQERELYTKFNNNEPGHGWKDDSGWWKYVEAAEEKPAPELKECEKCGFQSMQSAETCKSCGFIFKGKECIKCKQQIEYSASICRHCEASQGPTVLVPWLCQCSRRNPPDVYKCQRCGLPRGIPDKMNFKFLKENSDYKDFLSSESMSVKLPSESTMSALKLNVYYINKDITLEKDSFRIPLFIHSSSNEIYLYLDPKHEIFHKYQDRLEDLISIELAMWIRQNHNSKITDANRPLWSISNLYYVIHSEYWGKRVQLDPEEVIKNVKDFFNNLGEALPDLFKKEAQAFYDSLDENDQSRIIENLHKNNLLDRKDALIENGEFMKFLPEDLMISALQDYPSKFFDGNFWSDLYEKLDVPDPIISQRIKNDTVGKYRRCLDDMISFINYRNPDMNYIKKINQTIFMLKEKLTVELG